MPNSVVSVDIDKIYRLADEHEISINRLEKDAGLTNSTISRWDKADPKVSSLYYVAKILGIDMSKLLKETEVKK